VGAVSDMFAHNEVDFCQDIRAVAHHGNGAGPPITTLADLHVGCSEVFGKNDIRAVADLKGRTVGIAAAVDDELPVKIMGDLVGLDPARDIHWVTSLSRDPMELVAEGKIDPFVAIPPALQEVRARNIGHVIVSSLADPPWSQYYCCFFTARTDFARA